VRISVLTDDIESTLAKVEELGGQTVTPKTEIPDMGWFAVFKDPQGNLIGLFTY
jgi:predicted enzyme related to lactoylglutathione lyase